MNKLGRYIANLSVLIIGALAIIGMVNYLSARHHARYDWTADDYFSLSEKSINIVQELTQPVKVIVFLSPGREFYDDARELLEQYQAQSEKLEIEYVDPDRNRTRALELVQRYNTANNNVIIFESETRTKYITETDLVEFDYSGMQYGQQPTIKAFHGEEQITSAILEVTQTERPTVALTTGHGEPTLETARELLRQDNLEVIDLNLPALTAIPENCDALLVIGATSQFMPAELTVIENYLDRGGKVLLTLDPGLEKDSGIKSTGLEKLIERYGITADNDIVIDMEYQLPQLGPSGIFTQDYGTHPAVRPMTAISTIFLLTRSFSQGAVPEEYSYQPLIYSSANSWGEVDLNDLQEIEQTDNDLPGPLTLAFALEAADTGGMKLIVFGDADFITGEQLALEPNFDLFLNSVNYLTERHSLISIPPKNPKPVSITLTSDQMRNLSILTLALFPLISLISGIYIWIRRRV